jgi:sugar diacid utilization regulator
MGAVRDLPEPVTSLVRVAVDSDEPEALIAAAEKELGHPLGLAGPAGEALGRAPETEEGDRALAIAAAAARSGLVAPPGWRIIAIARSSSDLGFLAIGDGGSAEAERCRLVQLLTALLAEQLQRIALLRAHARAFVRRLVSEPELGARGARREAAELGLAVADAYWPALLGWRSRSPAPGVVDEIECVAHRARPGVLSVMRAGRLVLLHPDDGDDARVRSTEWLRLVAEHARRRAPSSRPQAITAERAVRVGELSGAVAELDALWRLGPRPLDEQMLVPAHRFALDRLLAYTTAGAEARHFVQQQIGPLIAWDRAHHTGLLTVLEAALDFPHHERAAAHCFMHRNTFRHRLRQATEILGEDLEDPDAMLAVHVALRLWRVLEAPSRDADEPSRVAAAPRARTRAIDSRRAQVPRR